MPKKITQEEIIKRAKKIHGNNLLYDKSVYVNMTTKMCVTCPIHGDFWIKPVNLIHQKNGCKYCSHQSFPSTKENFEQKANIVHDKKYNYDKVVYKNNKTKVCITCLAHGDFWIRPDDHLNGHGCPKCAIISRIDKQKFTKQKFECLAKKIHGEKYIYSKIDYKDYGTKVCIICKEHGEFWQTPDNHLHGHGCPYCNESKLEKKIYNLLTENNISFIRQKTFSWLKYKGNLFLDFYLPEYNIAIECQGIQHFKSIDFFGGEKEFKNIIARDAVKNALCENNGIKLIYFSNEKNNKIITNVKDVLKEIKNE